MTQPTTYQKAVNFTAYATANPGAPYPPASIDSELSAIKATLDQVCANLAAIQRDDTALANLLVTYDSLSTSLKAMLVSHITPRGAWGSAVSYSAGDMVEQAGTSYVCASEHVSGAFNTDYAAGRWCRVSGPQFVTAPASATAAGAPGQMAYDSNYLYVCVANNTWRRTAIATW